MCGYLSRLSRYDEGDFKAMGPRDVKNIINKGGTILKTARSKEFMTPEGRKLLMTI